MIYTTTMPKELARIFVPEHFIKVSNNNENIINDPNPVFVYDQHDLSLRNVSFDNFLPEDLWTFFKESNNAKILMYFSDEFLHYRDIDQYAEVIKRRNLDTSKIYFLVLDKNFEEYVIRKLAEQEVVGVNVHHFNMLMHKVDAVISTSIKENSTPKKKFSSLSRNFNIWRLHMFADLAKDNTLKDFIYSFHNINPYGVQGAFNTCTEYNINDFPKMLELNHFGQVTDTVDTWIKGMPYDVGDKFTKMATVTYETICKADLHLLIESHFDPYITDQGVRYLIPVKDFSPAFPTEKTYKALASSKPFISFAAPFFMEELKNLGYKTFSPYIDESYDQEVDNLKRLQMISSEVKRICSLNESEYNDLLQNCNVIAEYNRDVFFKQRNNISLTEKFEFLRPHIQEYYFK
jgi:hypothetical protein